MSKPRNIIGPFVRELREQKKLTQPMIVAKLNLAGWDISRGTYSKIEAQIRWVADFEIALLAAALGMRAGELLELALKSEAKKKNSKPR